MFFFSDAIYTPSNTYDFTEVTQTVHTDEAKQSAPIFTISAIKTENGWMSVLFDATSAIVFGSKTFSLTYQSALQVALGALMINLKKTVEEKVMPKVLLNISTTENFLKVIKENSSTVDSLVGILAEYLSMKLRVTGVVFYGPDYHSPMDADAKMFDRTLNCSVDKLKELLSKSDFIHCELTFNGEYVGKLLRHDDGSFTVFKPTPHPKG